MSEKTDIPLQTHIEALLFASAESVSPLEIQAHLNSYFTGEPISMEAIQKGIEELIKNYKQSQFSFEIQAVNGGYQFFTKPFFYPLISLTYKSKSKKKISHASLETLSIIAYQQPVSKSEIQKIRGVNCDYSIQSLLHKELIQIDTSSREKMGNAFLYKTSGKFLDFLGLNDLKDLPKVNIQLGSEEGQ